MKVAKFLPMCLLACAMVARVASECETAQWPAGFGADPFEANRGNVLVAAMVKGYCTYCVRQAMNLEHLIAHLSAHGYPEIKAILINGGEIPSAAAVGNLRTNTNLTVYQDDAQDSLNQTVFQAKKDDFVVFDRCGHRVIVIPHPYSYLGLTIAPRIIRSVHRGHHRCNCNLDPNRQTPAVYSRMYGDQPSPGVVAEQGGLINRINYQETAGSDLDINCPRSDRWCRRFERRRRHGTLGQGRDRRRGRGHQHGDHDECSHAPTENRRGRGSRLNRRRGRGREGRRHVFNSRRGGRHRGLGMRAHHSGQTQGGLAGSL